MPGGRYPWAVRAGGPLLGGGGALPIFDWNPEIGEDLPATAVFARASVAFYRNDSGVWVEAASGELRFHNGTAGGGSKGYLSETAATKLALFPRDFTNAVWVATDIDTAKDATGIDGVASAASTLTATAANGTILQSVTSASSEHTFSVFVARKTGTGTIDITVDGGTTWVDITSSISNDIKDDPYVVTQTLANPSIGFRIGTSGDEIEADMGDLEATPFATTPLDHSSGTAARAGDSVTDATILTSKPYSMFMDFTWPTFIDTTSSTSLFSVSEQRFQQNITGYNLTGGGSGINIIGGTVTNSQRQKAAISFADDDTLVSITSTPTGFDTSCTPLINTIGIGVRQANGLQQIRGRIHRFSLYDVAQTQAQLEALVA